MPLPSSRSLAALAFLVLGSAFAAASPQPDRDLSPTLIATNLWYGDPAPVVWEQAAAAGIRLVRIGGHAYDKKVPKDETLVAWVKKIREHGAEPLIQVSQYDGPDKAAELVRLFNTRRAAGAPIRLWNIGNEPWLQRGRKAPETVAAEVVAYWKPIAAAMKAVDPSIKIYGFDEAYLIESAYSSLFGGEHDITGLVPGKKYYYCDGLSWHRYPQTSHEPGLAEIADFEKGIRRARELVDAANAKHKRRGADALQWGLGEFNAKGGVQVHTFGNGQMFGAVYGLSARYGAAYAASWSLYESGGNRGGTDFGAFDGKDFTPRASYWHQRLFAENFSGVTLAGARSSREDVLVFAARDKKAGRLSVMILNLSGSAEPLPYELRLRPSDAPAEGLVLTLPLGSRSVYSDTLAPRSTQVLVFGRDSLKKITYNAEDFSAARPPTSTSLPAPFRLPR